MDDLNLFDEESVDLLIAALKESPDHDETSPLYRALLTAKSWMARAEVSAAVVRSVRLEPMGAEVAKAGGLEVEAELLRRHRDDLANQLRAAQKRADRADTEADRWKEEAKQYAGNSDHWRKEAERLRRRAAIAEESAAGARNNEEHLKGLVTELRREMTPVPFSGEGLAADLAALRAAHETAVRVSEDDKGTLLADLAALTERVGDYSTYVETEIHDRIEALAERVGSIEKSMATDSHAGIYCDIVSLADRVEALEEWSGDHRAHHEIKLPTSTAPQTCDTCVDGKEIIPRLWWCSEHGKAVSVGSVHRCHIPRGAK